MLNQTDLAYNLIQLLQLTDQAQRQYHRLVLVCGQDWQTRTQVMQATAQQMIWPYLAVGLALAEELASQPIQQRPLFMEQALEKLIPAGAGVVLDQLEILFDADFHANPLQLLERISRQRLVLASWPGQWQNGKLSYAEPWHAEYRSYSQGHNLCYALP